MGSTPATRTIFLPSLDGLDDMKFAPWICVAALLAGGYFLYSTSKEKDVELSQLRQENQEVTQLRADNEELKKLPAEHAELIQLRKDHEDLLRLRNEVRKLREQNKQLTGEAQAAQQRQEASQQALENQTLQIQQSSARATAQAQANACINTLRQIDGAKQQWALETKKTADAVPTPQDLAPYFPNGTFQAVCPAGGTYTLNAVGTPVTCRHPRPRIAAATAPATSSPATATIKFHGPLKNSPGEGAGCPKSSVFLSRFLMSMP